MKKVLLKWKRNWWQNTAGFRKIYGWVRSGIDKKISLKWKPDWWKNIAEMEARLMKNIAERMRDWRKTLVNESGIFYKIILYFAPNWPRKIVAPNCPTPNCPRRIVLRRIVRTPIESHIFVSTSLVLSLRMCSRRLAGQSRKQRQTSSPILYEVRCLEETKCRFEYHQHINYIPAKGYPRAFLVEWCIV